jgi:hypothetical protein
MKTISRFVIMAATLTVLAVAPACSPTTQNVVTSVTNAASSFEQTAQVVLNDAQLAWPIVVNFIPVAQQPVAQTDFSNAVFASNKALLALSDAIATAQGLNQANPDLTTVMQSVSDAVSQVVAIVNKFRSSAPPSTALTVSSYDPNYELNVLKKIGHTK